MGFYPVVFRLELGHGVEGRWVGGSKPSFICGKVQWGGDRWTAIPAREIQEKFAARGTRGANTPFPAMNIPLSISVLLPSSSPDFSHNGPACFPPCSCLGPVEGTPKHSGPLGPLSLTVGAPQLKVLRAASLKRQRHFGKAQKKSKRSPHIGRQAGSVLTIRGQLISLGAANSERLGSCLKPPDSGPGPHQLPPHGTPCGK